MPRACFAVTALVLSASLHGCLIDPKKDYPVATGTGAGSGGSLSAGTSGSGAVSGGAMATPGGAPNEPTEAAGAGGDIARAECGGGTQCSVGQTCEAGLCGCVGCRSTGIPGPGGSCLAPVTTTAEGTHDAADVPTQAIDADAATAWSSGDYSGHLTIRYADPQPVAEVVLLPNASAGGKIDFTILVEGSPGSPSQTASAKWATTDSNPWVVVSLPTAQLVTKLTVDAQSTTTWISLWEVMTTKCLPQ